MDGWILLRRLVLLEHLAVLKIGVAILNIAILNVAILNIASLDLYQGGGHPHSLTVYKHVKYFTQFFWIFALYLQVSLFTQPVGFMDKYLFLKIRCNHLRLNVGKQSFKYGQNSMK